MPNTIVFISCVKSKRQTSCAAQDMYVSPLFKRMLKYARTLNPNKIFILSAEYGLLQLDDVINPYEKTLINMKVHERKIWANCVLEQLRKEADLQSDRFVILAGSLYRENLIPHMAHCEVPMKGLAFGKQLQWLTKRTAE